MTKNWDIFPKVQPYGEDLANFSCYRSYEKSAIAGYGVLSGCAVSRTSTTEVAAASGTFTVAGVKKTFAGASLTSIAAAAAGKHRYDLVYIDGADDTLKLAAGTEDTPTSATDFLENYVPRPAEPTDTDWIILAVIRVTESGIENTNFGTNQYATGSVANMRLGPGFAVDDSTLQVVDGAISVKTSYVKADGTVPLTANWDVGTYKITANQLESDVAAGTPPLVVASDTVVPNLNASKLEGNAASAFAVAAKGVTNGDSHDHNGGDGAQIDHGNLGGLGDDDHSAIYQAKSLLSAAGDIIYASSAGVWARLAKSTDGYRLALVSGLPAWVIGNFGVHWKFGDGSAVVAGQQDRIRIPKASKITKAYVTSTNAAGDLLSGSVTFTIYIHDYNADADSVSASDSFALSSASSLEETGLNITVAAGKYITAIISGITTCSQVSLDLELEAT